MPGCSLTLIHEKLQTFPVKKALISLAIDTVAGAALGSATGALGAHYTGLDASTTALNGLTGGAALNVFLSLVISIYNHFAHSEMNQSQEQKQQNSPEPKKGWRESASNFYHSHFSKKNVEQAPPKEQKEPPKPISRLAIANTCLVLTAAGFTNSILSNMLGDAMFKMPNTIGDTAKNAAIGSSILTGMLGFIALAALCAPRLANCTVDCWDKFLDFVCCDREDGIENRRPLSETVRGERNMLRELERGERSSPISEELRRMTNR